MHVWYDACACARMCNMLTSFDFVRYCFPPADFLSFCFDVNWPGVCMCACAYFTHGIYRLLQKFLNAWTNNNSNSSNTSQIAVSSLAHCFYLQFVPVCSAFPSCWVKFYDSQSNTLNYYHHCDCIEFAISISSSVFSPQEKRRFAFYFAVFLQQIDVLVSNVCEIWNCIFYFFY